MNDLKLAKQLEGKHTLETLVEELGIKKSTALNIISRLRKKDFLKTEGGGRQKRIYTIKPVYQVKYNKGMFDILNKYSKNKVVPKFKHEVYGHYDVEDALIDLIKLKDFRILLESLRLFNHIKRWTYLHEQAKNMESIIGMLYDCARITIKIKRMPINIYKSLLNKRTKKKIILIPGLQAKDMKKIEKKWNVQVPFAKKDLEAIQ